ncbi:MAG TPA: helix-turn-helix transcriptional regulator [Acetobacteraceae bacterium]|nr:helix-turn-helix transcriptional regulator [Acetobacteraceae bacterium]
MQRFTPEERAEIKAHADALIAEEMSLRELRKAMGRTQAQLARKLKKPQATVSRIERQSDMLISTLDRVVHALGGRVRIVAELPGRRPLYVTGLAELAGAAAGTKVTKGRPASGRRRPAARVKA